MPSLFYVIENGVDRVEIEIRGKDILVSCEYGMR